MLLELSSALNPFRPRYPAPTYSVLEIITQKMFIRRLTLKYGQSETRRFHFCSGPFIPKNGKLSRHIQRYGRSRASVTTRYTDSEAVTQNASLVRLRRPVHTKKRKGFPSLESYGRSRTHQRDAAEGEGQRLAGGSRRKERTQLGFCCENAPPCPWRGARLCCLL